jgi:thymidine kinase
MFSGKSEELIRRLKRESYAEKKILAVKPRIDTRTENAIAARSKNKVSGKFEPSFQFEAIPVAGQDEFEELVAREKPDVLAIDEAQFFGDWLPSVLDVIIGMRFVDKVIIAGLDMDAWGRPFGPMPALLAMADDFRKETAVCFHCKSAPANMTYKVSRGSGEQVEVGDAGLYEARCRNCWTPPPEE